VGEETFWGGEIRKGLEFEEGGPPVEGKRKSGSRKKYRLLIRERRGGREGGKGIEKKKLGRIDPASEISFSLGKLNFGPLLRDSSTFSRGGVRGRTSKSKRSYGKKGRQKLFWCWTCQF